MSRHRVGVRSLLLWGASLALALAVALPASASTVQLTSSADYSGSPSVNGTGSVVAFESEADLTGGNADNSREVFVINADGTGLKQLTSDASWGSCHPVISADGSVMVFQSQANLTGGNSDNSFEIFVINSDGTGLKQLTDDSGGMYRSCAPRISGDGSLVAFTSAADLTGGNSDHSQEIFVVNSDGTGLKQLTSQPDDDIPCFLPAIDADGSLVTFTSPADLLTGSNPDKSLEIFVINSDGTGLRQVTSDTGGNSVWSSISADGAVIAFMSEADLTGGNGDHNEEVYIVNADGTGLRQLTSDASYGSGFPYISADGAVIAFMSEADLTGGNGNHDDEVYVVNADGTGLQQLTSGGSGHFSSEAYSITADGSVVAVQSDADLTGGNADGSDEVFLVSVEPEEPEEPEEEGEDAWQVALDDEDPPNRIMDLPTGLNWDATYSASVDAENTGTTTWTSASYALLSVEGVTPTVTAVDRWGLTSVALSADVPSGAVNSFGFTVTAPPISGTFECDWSMGNTGVPFGPDLAEADVLLTRFADTLPGTAGEWAASAVETCAGRVPPIVLGYPDGLYRPGLTINRGAMAVYMQRAAMIPKLNPAEPTFPDVPADHWAYTSIEACADAGIVFGYGDGSYQPNLGVTRAQMAVYVARAVPLDFDPDVDPAADVFPDVPIGFWADNEIEVCVNAGVVQGYPDGLYRPTAWVDRGQMAVYAMRAFISPTPPDVVVLGGPGTTLVPLDPVPSYHGWSTATIDPTDAYVEFDAAHLGPELATAGTGTWDVTFYFGADATPTSTPESVTVEDSAGATFDAADLTGLTGDYFTAAVAIPTMTPGMKLMWVEVETPTGGAYQLGRTVMFEQLEPPPPPGSPRTPNAIGDAAWNVLAEDDRPGAAQLSGTFSAMKFADDEYFVMRTTTLPVTSWNEGGGCCESTGVTLQWNGLEVPVGATEMVLRLEYRVGGEDTDQNGMSCCSNNMCEEWGGYNDDPAEGPIDLVWWIDGVHTNYGWGLVMVNYADCWDWDGTVTGSPSAEIQDLPAEGGLGGMFAYHPFGNDSSADGAMTWTVSDWTNFLNGDQAMIHFCGGGTTPFWYIDQCTIEFNPHP